MLPDDLFEDDFKYIDLPFCKMILKHFFGFNDKEEIIKEY